ncbi:MAG: hypothetical protein GY953_27010 [bacterium]|nr:hypothetical protein [bacterium]
MIWLLLALLTQANLPLEDRSPGARVFARSCAVGYCHGTAGSTGRAPRIRGRRFERDYLLRVTRDGIAGTAMLSWKDRLSETEIEAVVDYMVSISKPAEGGARPATPESRPATTQPPKPVPLDVSRGKVAFFDATRGTRCGTCHALEGWGVPVGPNLASAVPGSAVEIRELPTIGVQTARLDDEGEFPALVVEQAGGWVRLYDLSMPPPVLRTLPAAQVELQPGSSWTHAAVIPGYSDWELTDIIAYLRWLGNP